MRSRTRPLSLAALTLAGLLTAAGCASAQNPGEPITQDELMRRLDSDEAPLVLDVRTASEYTAGHVPGAINIPHTALAARLGELGEPRSREVVVYCESGRRAGTAEKLLRKRGFTAVRHLEGDMSAWRERELPCTDCSTAKD